MGGRVCSMVMIMNSPTFDGGFPMCGTNSLTSWKNPDRGRLRHAARKDRFVFYTGKNDPNRESVKSVANNYRKKGFRYVKYLEDSNAGHEVASTDYVRKAIEYLDDPTRTGSTPGGSDQPRPGTEKPGGESDGSGTSTGQGGNRGQAGSQGQETGEEQGQKPQRPPLGTILNEPGAVKGNRPWENAWQLQTPHFNIRSNISKEATREIGYVMEALYKNFNQLLNASLRSRVDVLVPKNRQGFDQIKRMPGQVRGYFTTRDGGKIVTYYHPGEIHHTTATLLHEGTHLIVMSTLRFRPLDIWINEGLAVYFEASKFERTDMTIGMKPKGRLRVAKQLVKSGQYVPIRKLIRLKQRQFTALHYAQAWSLVHYLVHAHDNKFVNKLDQYIISFKNYPDVSPTRRFRKFFPISFDELEKDWKRYVRELSLTGEDVVRIGTESQK